jgi:23S rRNA (uracil1939-C5)-methyltransferase
MFGRSWRRLWGDPAVAYAVDGVSLVTTGGEFTQVNLAGNRLLVDAVLDLGRVSAGDRVLDLYCGAGNLALPAARRGALVTGVERSQRAIADAIANARRLAVDARFVCSPVETVLAGCGSTPGPLDLVILDPPRGGAAGVVEGIARLGPRRIVYVSCDPPTLARDLATLTDHGFRPEAIQPIDLFPHTYHLEAVAALSAAR